MDNVFFSDPTSAAVATPAGPVGTICMDTRTGAVYEYAQADTAAAVSAAGTCLFYNYSATGGLQGAGGLCVREAVTLPYAKAGISMVASAASLFFWIQIAGLNQVAIVMDATGVTAGDVCYPASAATVSVASSDANRIKGFGFTTLTCAASTNITVGRFQIVGCL